MKLYYSPGSSSLAVHIALIETELEFELIRVDRKTKLTSDGEDYYEINSTGFVPALDVDSVILTENVAILYYIGTTTNSVYSSTAINRSHLIETLAFIASELHKSFKPMLAPDGRADTKEAAKETLRSRYGIMDGRLGDNEFILGNKFSVADCYLFVTIFWARNFAKIDLPKRLSDYFDRIERRPAVRHALKAEGLI